MPRSLLVVPFRYRAGDGVFGVEMRAASFTVSQPASLSKRAGRLGAVSRSHMLATDPLFDKRGWPQTPASGFAEYTRPPRESGYLSASASVLRIRGAGRRARPSHSACVCSEIAFFTCTGAEPLPGC